MSLIVLEYLMLLDRRCVSEILASKHNNFEHGFWIENLQNRMF